jgi:small ligand-binding sensory domain FIST
LGQMYFASASSSEPDAGDVAVELVAQIEKQMQGHAIDCAFIFLSPHFAQAAGQLSRDLRAALHPRLLIGCTGEGVISSDREIEQEPAVTMVAAHLPQIQLTPFLFEPRDWRSVLADPTLLSGAVVSERIPKLFLILADPFTTPMDELLETFNTAFGGVPVVGGLASGAQRSQGNVLILNDRILSSGAIGVTWSGAFQVDVIVSQGCRPVGESLTVTAVEKNMILGIEGLPPLVHIHALVAELTETERELIQSNGLFVGRAVGPPEEQLGRGDFLIRGVIGLDQESGAIAVGDTLDEGETIQFHLRDAATAEEDLEMVLLSQAFSDAPRGGLLFSCNGRGTKLYKHPDGDISTIKNALGDVQMAGLFCAGEIGPIGDKNFVHGHTASLALFRPATHND